MSAVGRLALGGCAAPGTERTAGRRAPCSCKEALRIVTSVSGGERVVRGAVSAARIERDGCPRARAQDRSVRAGVIARRVHVRRSPSRGPAITPTPLMTPAAGPAPSSHRTTWRRATSTRSSADVLDNVVNPPCSPASSLRLRLSGGHRLHADVPAPRRRHDRDIITRGSRPARRTTGRDDVPPCHSDRFTVDHRPRGRVLGPLHCRA